MAHNVLPRHVFDFGLQVIVARSLQQQSPAPPELPGLRPASLADADLLSVFGTSLPAIEGRFESGNRAWLIEREGRAIACDWLGADNRKSIWEWLILQGRVDDIWHEYFEVVQEARGQGLGPRMRAHVIHYCEQKGYSRLLGNVELDNRRSLRAMQKAGYKQLVRFWYVRFGNKTLVRHGGRTHIGRWDANNQYILRLD